MIATYTRTNPFPAKLISCEVLTKPGSSKEILHVVLDLADSGIVYEVGSSFGLIPENSPAAVEAIMAHVQDGPVQLKTGETVPFREFLTRHANLYQVTSRHFALAGAEAKPCNLALFLQEHPTLPLQAIVDVTAPLLPRYYSIASSMKHVGNQVHFMIASFAYTDALGLPRESITASFLKANPSSVRLFLQENKTFLLPSNPDTPIIMIGPGTGLAAFRGFIQERTQGRNWLFTGDRNESTDFHYKEELLAHPALRVTTAFSRDTDQKCYVQHRLLEHKQELWAWLQNGAHLYICGDAKSMAKDVQAALHHIAETEGALSQEEAKTFFKTLRSQKRFLLDVY